MEQTPAERGLPSGQRNAATHAGAKLARFVREWDFAHEDLLFATQFRSRANAVQRAGQPLTGKEIGRAHV